MDAQVKVIEENFTELKSSEKVLYFAVKRMIDIVLSLIGIICLFPLFLLLPLLSG